MTDGEKRYQILRGRLYERLPVLALALGLLDWRKAENLSVDEEAVRRVALAKEEKEAAEKKFKEFVSGLDKAVKKGIISKNTADRKKSRAQLKLNKMAK